MILRVLSGTALLLLGYYIGREVGRAEPIRKELEQAQENDKKHNLEKASKKDQ